MQSKKLRQVLAQEDAVLFIGAGVSMWSGLPSWPRLIDELAAFLDEEGLPSASVREERARGDLLQAASLGIDRLTPSQFGVFIRRACRLGTARPHEIHRKIISLGPTCYVTTNYDDLIEQSLHRWKPNRSFRGPVTNRQLTGTADIIQARSSDFVFKPHGDVGDTESIILTHEQYRALLPDGELHRVLEALKTLMLTRPIVYLGFGLRDPNFIFLKNLLANTFKGSARDHYAVMADTTEDEERFWLRHYGIHIISYRTTTLGGGNRDHTPLLGMLDELIPALPLAAPLEGSSTLVLAESVPRTVVLSGAASQVVASMPASTEVAPPTAATSSAPTEASSPTNLQPSESAGATLAAEEMLRVTRYAAGLTRHPRVSREFPLRVTSYRMPSKALEPGSFRFEGKPVESFLIDGPPRAVLIGPPGAGKSYALRQAVALLAERLHDACLADPFFAEDIVIPIYVDLKLYDGDLYRQMEIALPPKLPLSTLARSFKLRLFLDSFNELPRKHWEFSSYEADFAAAFTKVSPFTVTIASRSSDGLAKLAFPAWGLDQIDEAFVSEELNRLGINVEGRFRDHTLRLLQKPFYFNLVANRGVAVPKEPHPKDVFKAVFDDLSDRLRTRFATTSDLIPALSLAAYDAIDRGDEAMPLSDILDVLATSLREDWGRQINVSEIANWLVSSDILVPNPSSRVSYFHQSATEYLAARELARQFQTDQGVIGRKLRLTRWDQAIFLTLSLLPEGDAQLFIDAVIEADLALALHASRYIEHGRDEVVTRLLSELIARGPKLRPFEEGLEQALEFGVEVSQVHVSLLRAIMKRGNMLGAAAVLQLVKVEEGNPKQELLEALYEQRDDYNYCVNGVARAIGPHLEPADLTKLFELAERLDAEMTLDVDEDEDEIHGFVSGCGALLDCFELDIVKRAFFRGPGAERSTRESVRIRCLCEMLMKSRSAAALELAAELLLAGVDRAATLIYFIASPFRAAVQGSSWSTFHRGHVNRLLELIRNVTDKSWSVRALARVCAARGDLADYVVTHARSARGVLGSVLQYCVSRGDLTVVFESLSELAGMSAGQLQAEPLHLLNQIELDWIGREELLIRLLKLRNIELARAFLEGLNSEKGPPELDLGPIDWWIDWLVETDSEKSDSAYFFQDRLSRFISRYLSVNARRMLVAKFNAAEPHVKRTLARSILLKLSDLTSDSLDPEALAYLIDDLRVATIRPFEGHLLGRIATDAFVAQQLLPLVSPKPGLFQDNLRTVIRDAGRRHGRRYLPN